MIQANSSKIREKKQTSVIFMSTNDTSSKKLYTINIGEWSKQTDSLLFISNSTTQRSIRTLTKINADSS